MTDTVSTTEPQRGLALPSLMEILRDRQARKIDLVVPAPKLHFTDGDLDLKGLEWIVESDGVTDPNGRYRPTRTFDDHLSERLDIHPSYLRRLRAGRHDKRSGKEISPPRLDLYDANANGLLAGRKPKTRIALEHEIQASMRGERDDVTWYGDTGRIETRAGVDGDSRSFLARLFRSDETGRGIARGLLSNRYLRVDDLDGLMAMMSGIVEAGVDPSTLQISGDLTETRMYVRVMAPEVCMLAPELLDGYRAPRGDGRPGGRSVQERIELGQRLVAERGWTDRGGAYAGGLNPGSPTAPTSWRPGEEPIVHAGFRMMNSELGNGRWMVVPEVVVLACDNGMVQTKEALARTHVGSKLDDGHIAWSADTIEKELEWVKAQTRDLVKLALSQDYLETTVESLTEKSGKAVGESKAEKAVEVLGKRLSFTQGEQDAILRHFLLGGQQTAGGMMQAITSASQTLDDADRAYELDSKAVEALEVLASTRL